MRASVTEPRNYCPNCDTILEGETRICPQCGNATFVVGGSQDPERLQRALGPHYQVKEVIGEGAFGVVYAVRDLPLERDLAIKVLHTPTMDLLIRFGREARILGKLRHPNIVPVHFVGAAEGIPYMVMPRIVGENLRSLIRRNHRLRVDMALEIAIAVCSALQTAHSAGIVHRDVKPDNILLEGEECRVQVMDFGIAKILENRTVVGTLIGTVEYMSPEQFTQDPQIDGRSDVYSMGCVLYKMLAGRPRFRPRGPPGSRSCTSTSPSSLVASALSGATCRPV